MQCCKNTAISVYSNQWRKDINRSNHESMSRGGASIDKHTKNTLYTVSCISNMRSFGGGEWWLAKRWVSFLCLLELADILIPHAMNGCAKEEMWRPITYLGICPASKHFFDSGILITVTRCCIKPFTYYPYRRKSKSFYIITTTMCASPYKLYSHRQVPMLN